MGHWVVMEPQERPCGSSHHPAPVPWKPNWQPGPILVPTSPGILGHCCPHSSSPEPSLVTLGTKSHCQDKKPMIFLTKQLLPSKAM